MRSDENEVLFEAEVALHSACALDSSNADSQCQLGVVLLREGKVLPARRAFEAALKMQATHLDASDNLRKVKGLCDEIAAAALAVEAAGRSAASTAEGKSLWRHRPGEFLEASAPDPYEDLAPVSIPDFHQNFDGDIEL
eukprot:TRINITY_DN33903_c0_g1_i1.p2 TRINITY_DN33903_c0_g1~~TRINITY_DN33903_c0_g1_i1.p2  ORF type:complete len:155 (-),score=35.67 TRINITY_DN33903_c0_g1_i1:194-610(-)